MAARGVNDRVVSVIPVSVTAPRFVQRMQSRVRGGRNKTEVLRVAARGVLANVVDVDALRDSDAREHLERDAVRQFARVPAVPGLVPVVREVPASRLSVGNNQQKELLAAREVDREGWDGRVNLQAALPQASRGEPGRWPTCQELQDGHRYASMFPRICAYRIRRIASFAAALVL